jgi:integrase
MSVFQRGSVWWYKFKFLGQSIRESSKSRSKTVAKEAEKAHRRRLEIGFNQIPQRKQAPLFAVAAREWHADKENLAPKTKLGYQQRLKLVNKTFAHRLLCDITLSDIVQYRSARIADGASNRTVNYEVGCIRGVLKRHGLWSHIGDRIKTLRENQDVGKAVSSEDENKLFMACGASKAPSLLPLFVFARDTGLRSSEIKALRRCDLNLTWKAGVIAAGEVIVPKSKTEAGTGRSVPFTKDVCSTLTIWLSRFPTASDESFVFPRHQVWMLKGGKETRIVQVALSKPMRSWQRAWRTALKEAGVKYRWHDLRHTFITRLAENPAVSEQTIRALAGHVSKQMMERYSHIRKQAKQDAIAALSSARSDKGSTHGQREKARSKSHSQGVQKWAQ